MIIFYLFYVLWKHIFFVILLRFEKKVKSYHPDHTLKCYILQLHHESRRYKRETERAKLLQNNKEIGHNKNVSINLNSQYINPDCMYFFLYLVP